MNWYLQPLKEGGFDAADYLEKDEANRDEMNLVKIFNKRIDMIFIDRYVAAHIIVRKFPHYMEQLEFMEPHLEEKSFMWLFPNKRLITSRSCKALTRA